MGKRALVPTTTTTAGRGSCDTIAQGLAACAAQLEDAGDLRDAGLRYHNGIERVRRCQWTAADAVTAKMNECSPARSAMADQITSQGQANGIAPAQIEQAIVASEVRFRDQMVTAVLAERSEEMSATAEAARAEGLEFKNAIDRAVLDYFGPSGMREAPTVEQIMQEERLRGQLRTLKPGQLEEMWSTYASQRDADAMRRFADAVTPVLVELRDTPPAKLVSRFGGRADDAEQARTVAWRLTQAIEDFRRASIPEEITIARAAFDALTEIFREVCGVHGRYITSLDAFLADGGANTDDPLQIDRNFVRRYLGGRNALPGWTPIVGRRSETNTPLRASATR